MVNRILALLMILYLIEEQRFEHYTDECFVINSDFFEEFGVLIGNGIQVNMFLFI